MYKLILIDADDTLFDYQRAEKYSLDGVFSHFKITEEVEKLRSRYQIINSKLWQDLEKGLVTKDELRHKRFEILFNEFSMNFNPMEASDVYVNHLKKSNFLLDGAYELCQYLHNKYKIVIVTNGIKEVQISRIEKSIIKDFIHHLVISDDVGIAKPDPRIFEHAVNLVGNPDKSEIIMIGDSLSSDIRGAHNFGIDSCWYNIHKIENSSDLTPKYEILGLNELYEIV